MEGLWLIMIDGNQSRCLDVGGRNAKPVTDVCSFILRYFVLATCLFLDCKIWLEFSCHKAAPKIPWYFNGNIYQSLDFVWQLLLNWPEHPCDIDFFGHPCRFSAGCGHPATLHAAGWWWHGGGAHGGCSTSICKWDMIKIICVCCCCCFL